MVAAEGPPRQALLADSLLVDLARAIKEGRERASRLADLRQRAAELSAYKSSKARALREPRRSRAPGRGRGISTRSDPAGRCDGRRRSFMCWPRPPDAVQSSRGLRALGTRSTKGWRPLGCRAAEWCCARLPIRTMAWNSREGRSPIASRCERLASGFRDGAQRSTRSRHRNRLVRRV